MRHRTLRRPFALTALVIAALAGSAASASAAGHAGAVHGRGVFLADPPAPPPIMPAPMPTGINTCCHNEAGVPDTSTPGIMGTGAAPSGLVGDNPAAPGFPAPLH